MIQRALAILPAFASPAYLTHKASSSVAASIICGTPLLADAALLNSYSYLAPAAVFQAAEGEREASAMSWIAACSGQARPGPTWLCAAACCAAGQQADS